MHALWSGFKAHLYKSNQISSQAGPYGVVLAVGVNIKSLAIDLATGNEAFPELPEKMSRMEATVGRHIVPDRTNCLTGDFGCSRLHVLVVETI
jgi:hypothetical protein